MELFAVDVDALFRPLYYVQNIFQNKMKISDHIGILFEEPLFLWLILVIDIYRTAIYSWIVLCLCCLFLYSIESVRIVHKIKILSCVVFFILCSIVFLTRLLDLIRVLIYLLISEIFGTFKIGGLLI